MRFSWGAVAKLAVTVAVVALVQTGKALQAAEENAAESGGAADDAEYADMLRAHQILQQNCFKALGNSFRPRILTGIEDHCAEALKQAMMDFHAQESRERDGLASRLKARLDFVSGVKGKDYAPRGWIEGSLRCADDWGGSRLECFYRQELRLFRLGTEGLFEGLPKPGRRRGPRDDWYKDGVEVWECQTDNRWFSDGRCYVDGTGMTCYWREVARKGAQKFEFTKLLDRESCTQAKVGEQRKTHCRCG